MRSTILLLIPTLAGCFPNVASDDRVDGVDSEVDTLRAELQALQGLPDTVAAIDARLATLEANMATLQGQVSTMAGAMEALTSRVDDQALALAEHSSTLDGHESRLQALETEAASLDDAVANLSDELGGLSPIVDALEVSVTALSTDAVTVIASDVTYPVSSTTDLDAVIEVLSRAHILPEASVTIDFADGTYTFLNSLRIDHPDGAHIRLVGNVSDPSRVVLDFSGSDGVVVPAGRDLGVLSGFTLTGDSTADTVGISVEANATLAWGNLNISDFDEAGVRVRYGGALIPDDPSCVGDYIETSGMSYGFEVSEGGVADVCNAVVSGASETGFLAHSVAYIGATESSSAHNKNGYVANYGAMIDADGSESEDNSSLGFMAQFGGNILATSSTATSNDWGYLARYGGIVNAASSSASNNTEHGYVSSVGSSMYARYARSVSSGTFGFAATQCSAMEASDSYVSGGTQSWYADTMGHINATSGVASGYTLYAFGIATGGGATSTGATYSGSGSSYPSSVSLTNYGSLFR